jgi:5-methyltetrahydrofolate--homocysteine methyltransferase
MAIGAGMTSAITNPLEPEIMQAIRASDVLTGSDRDCAAWIRSHRLPTPEGAGNGRRRTGRRRQPTA